MYLPSGREMTIGKWKVLLPKTSFPLRVNPIIHEPAIQKGAKFDHLYKWQQNRMTDKHFTLHDGPPFANGELHMGHVLNKVLKDIVNRYKVMKGFKIHYRPGWDCHGLPIELKACQNLPRGTSAMDIRQTAKSFANKTIKMQKKSFKRWGLLGDWDNPYITMSKEYESKQIDVFYRMHKQGGIYRGFKPVYWSPSSVTALAEAELEYHEHTSRSVFVIFPSRLPNLQEYGEINALVWTTTPWTLPANRAICYHPKHFYTLVRSLDSKELLLVGAERLPALKHLLGNFEVVNTFSGSSLVDGEYTSLFDSSCKSLFIPGDHVSSEEGTGLVHTAPAHGFEDYIIGLNHNLDSTCLVNDEGKYVTEVGPELQGLEVLGSGNEAVISKLKSIGKLIHEGRYTHRYPYDWRTKKPVIIRSTKQWFASLDSLKDEAIAVLKKIKGVPESAVSRLKIMMEGRYDWCISRQRVWGVPIPVFLSLDDDDYLMNDETISHVQEQFSINGSDCWWSKPIKDLLPSSMKHLAEYYRKGTDTMDVWFDSGSSWASVLDDTEGVADIYLEGSDQYRGWFQSSLLTSLAAQGKSPYKQLVSHGFVLDMRGTKMSKSLGNVITPDDIIHQRKYGADVMRLWVASSDFTTDVAISMNILQQRNEFLQKIRNTFRFILGNLAAFEPKRDLVPFIELPPLDKYQLHKLQEFYAIANQAYDNFNFAKLYHTLVTFVPHDLSAFYFDLIKDRLYCDLQCGHKRRSCQTVLYHHLIYFLTSLAPILPHLVEEVAQHYEIEKGI